MKSLTKALVIICILVVSVTVATACTGSSCTASTTTGTTSTDLPTKDEVNSAILAAKLSNTGNFAENFFSSIKTNHSTWHVDLWASGSQEVVSVYYSISQGSYGSYYLDETGNLITPSTSLALKEKYAGDGIGATSGTCTGSNCPLSTNSSNVICPTCGQSAGYTSNNTTPTLTPTLTPATPAVSQVSTTTPSTSIILTSGNNSTLTAEQQQELDNFMNYFNGKESVTKDGIKEQAVKCFFHGGQ